jgi:hypothetical protein
VKKAGDYVFLSKKGREVVRQVGEVAEASRTAYTSAERNLSDTYRALTKESRSTLSSEIRKRIATLKTELAAELYDLHSAQIREINTTSAISGRSDWKSKELQRIQSKHEREWAKIAVEQKKKLRDTIKAPDHEPGLAEVVKKLENEITELKASVQALQQEKPVRPEENPFGDDNAYDSDDNNSDKYSQPTEALRPGDLFDEAFHPKDPLNDGHRFLS